MFISNIVITPNSSDITWMNMNGPLPPMMLVPEASATVPSAKPTNWPMTLRPTASNTINSYHSGYPGYPISFPIALSPSVSNTSAASNFSGNVSVHSVNTQNIVIPNMNMQNYNTAGGGHDKGSTAAFEKFESTKAEELYETQIEIIEV